MSEPLDLTVAADAVSRAVRTLLADAGIGAVVVLMRDAPDSPREYEAAPTLVMPTSGEWTPEVLLACGARILLDCMGEDDDEDDTDDTDDA